MTLDEAKAILRGQPHTCIVNMRRALEMMTWKNTPGDWQRLEACYVYLRVPKAKRITIPENDHAQNS